MVKDLQDLTVEEDLNRIKRKVIEILRKKIQMAEGAVGEEKSVDRGEVSNIINDEDVRKVINDVRNFIELIKSVRTMYRTVAVFINERKTYRDHHHESTTTPRRSKAPDQLDGEYLNNIRRMRDGSNKIIHDLVDVVREIKDLVKANLTEVDDSDLNDLIKYITELRDRMMGMGDEAAMIYPIGNNGRNRAGNNGLTLFERTPGLNETIELLGRSLADGIVYLSQVIDYLRSG